MPSSLAVSCGVLQGTLAVCALGSLVCVAQAAERRWASYANARFCDSFLSTRPT